MFDHCIYFNTTALARMLEREWASAFAPMGLTPPQAFMLRVVLEKPGLLQREIADELTISRPTATRALDALQEKGLIRRETTERDGREYAIKPTEAAIALRDSINHASGEVTKRIKKKLGATEFDEVVTRLRGIRSTFK